MHEVLLEHSQFIPVHLCAVRGCFCGTTKLNSCDRDLRAHRVQNIYYLVLSRGSFLAPGSKYQLSFISLTNLQFERYSVGMDYLCSFQCHMRWLKAGSESPRGRNCLKPRSLTCLVVGGSFQLGPLLELLVRSPIRDLSMWLSDSLIAWF